MQTKVNVTHSQACGYVVEVTRTDGSTLRLPAATVERASTVAFFLLDAFSQEAVAAIDETHKRVTAALDALEAKVRGAGKPS